MLQPSFQCSVPPATTEGASSASPRIPKPEVDWSNSCNLTTEPTCLNSARTLECLLYTSISEYGTPQRRQRKAFQACCVWSSTPRKYTCPPLLWVLAIASRSEARRVGKG